MRTSLPPDPEVLVEDSRARLSDGGESLDLRPREAVDLVVEERQQQSLADDQFLDLAVDGVTDARIGLGTPPLDKLIKLRPSHEATDRASLGVEGAVRKRVRVGIVRAPAPHGEVGLPLPVELEILGDRLVEGAD